MTSRPTAALVAVATLAVAIVAVAAPWLEGPGADAGLGTLARSAVPYERGTALGALAGLAVAVAALACLAAWPALPPDRVRALWLAVLASSVPMLLAATRLCGFALARALDAGGATVAPGPAVWALLALAVVLPGAAVPRLAPRRAADAVAAVAAATLALLPLVPYGTSASGTFHYDELTLAAAAQQPGVLTAAGKALAWLRMALLATAAAGGLARLLGAGVRANLVLVAPGVVASCATAALFLARWTGVQGLGLPWNPAFALGPPAAAAALLAAAWKARRAPQPSLAPSVSAPNDQSKEDPSCP